MTLLVVVHAPGGLTQRTGLAEVEFTIWVGSRLDACITAEIAVTTAVSLGKVVPPVHVAHGARAAVIAPCCAACWMVE